MKKINDYKLPKHYIEIINSFYEFLNNNYKDRILLFTLGGSTVFENVIEGLSDIDFMIIMDKCSPEDYRKIYEYKNKFDIKLCGSIFTLNEVNNKQIDYLSMYYLYLIRINYIDAIYLSNKLNINISKEDLYSFIKKIVILNLRTLKEMSYSRKLRDTHILIKYILHLEKDYLILNDYYGKSKEDIISRFNSLFNLDFNISIDECYYNKLSDKEYNLLLEYIDKIIIIFNDLKY